MKKIAIASAAMGGAALIAFGASGTFAAFSDTENLRGEAGAATLDLAVGDSAVPPAAQAQNMTPGGPALSFPYHVANTGDLKGFLALDIELTDYEHSCSGDEFDWDATCGAANDPGEFSQQAKFSVRYAENVTEANCTKDARGLTTVLQPTSIPAGTPTTLSVPAVLPINSGFNACVIVDVLLPTTATNAVQGDSAALEVGLRLEQIQGAAAATPPAPRA